MKALKYGLKENALRALNAGCNLVLHCSGNMQEMGEIIKIIPKIDNFVIKKTKQFRCCWWKSLSGRGRKLSSLCSKRGVLCQYCFRKGPAKKTHRCGGDCGLRFL